MARRARRLQAGGCYHVHNRGALRRTLFATPADWPLFIGALRDVRRQQPIELLAWCLMPNHWHLLVRQQDACALPRFMRWLTLAHSHRWQALHGRTGQGTLYQGRYRSHPVATDAHLFTVVRYIERNPVRAGLVQRPMMWPWSSLHERMRGRPDLLAPLPTALPDDWLIRLEKAETAAELAACRGNDT